MASVENPSNTGGRLIAASKVNGTSVYNTAGESLGSVHDVMLTRLRAKPTMRSSASEDFWDRRALPSTALEPVDL
jgi:hypothetical protein